VEFSVTDRSRFQSPWTRCPAWRRLAAGRAGGGRVQVHAGARFAGAGGSRPAPRRRRAQTTGLALRRPSLDDVFMALTGHVAEEIGAADVPPGPGRRAARTTLRRSALMSDEGITVGRTMGHRGARPRVVAPVADATDHLVTPSLAQRAAGCSRLVGDDDAQPDRLVASPRLHRLHGRATPHVRPTFPLRLRRAIKVPCRAGTSTTSSLGSSARRPGLPRSAPPSVVAEISRGGIDRIRSMPTAGGVPGGPPDGRHPAVGIDGTVMVGVGYAVASVSAAGRLRHRHDRPGHPASRGRLLRLGLHRPGRQGRGGRAGLRLIWVFR